MFIDTVLVLYLNNLQKPIVNNIVLQFNLMECIWYHLFCTGITNDIFHHFGTTDNATEKIKVTDKRNINAE